MTERPAVIFFDCFNTLIEEHHEPGEFAFMAPSDHMAASAGFYADRGEFQRDYARWHERNWDYEAGQEVTYHARAGHVLEQRDPSRKHEIEALVAEMVSHFEENYPSCLAPAPGVEAMLEAWRGEARLAVVSNFHLVGYPERVLEQFGLLAHFDFVLNSAEFGWKKPDQRIYREALQRAGVENDRVRDVLFVGDSHANDVTGPRQAGMRAMHYLPSHGTQENRGDGREPVLVTWRDFHPDRWPPKLLEPRP